MKRHTFILSALAAVALAGCSHMGMSGSGSSSGSSSTAAAATGGAGSAMEVYTATLSPSEEVPPATDSQGTGTAEVRVDPRTNEMTWKVSYSGLTGPATMGHIHGPASPGTNAGVVVPFTGIEGKTSAEGKGKLTQAQYGDLAAGLYYVNVHTAKHPGGEIRGQLKRK